MMNKKLWLRAASSTAISLSAFFAFGSVNAQTSQTETGTVNDEVIVTGSYIKRSPANSASPLSIISRDTLEDQGVSNPIDFVKFLTINTGSDFNADIFSAGGWAGTANYNLRGLGVGSTLVLLNGRRTTFGGANPEFIDINTLLPNIMIDRIEILKDGASSLYGSDAVAGVVNHITRDRHVGGEIRAEYRDGQGDQGTIQVDGLYGFELGESTNVVAAVSYVDQDDLLASERDFAAVSSGVGSPGAFFPQTAGGANIGGPVADPLCGIVGGTPSSFPGGPGVCNFDLAPFTDLVTDDERFLAMLTIRHDLESGAEIFADLNYSSRRSFRTGAPSFPGLRPVSVPLTHPRIGDAPTFTGIPPILGQLRYFGRPFGTGYEPLLTSLEDKYLRASAGIRGDIGDKWTYEAALTYGNNDFKDTTTNDVLFDVLQDAINDGTFNPFATALDGTAPNDQAVIDSIRADLVRESDSSLFSIDGVVTRDLFEMGGGTAGLAIGGQYRKNKREIDYNDDANAERFYFLVGAPDSGGDASTVAVFAEAVLPVTDWMEIQAAVRYENFDIDGIGDTIDPKIAVLIRPDDRVSLRGSYSTAFRAPQVNQLFETTVTVGAAFDPVADAVIFAPVRTIGNEDLKPETAETLNVGFTFEPNDTFSFSTDYWSFDYEDLITVQNATSIVIANLGDPSLGTVIRSNGVLQEIQRTLINAPSLSTEGLDFTVSVKTELPKNGLQISALANATHILSYNLVEAPGGDVLDLAGARNYTNSGSPSPEWRANLTLAAQKGPVRGSITGRHISGFTNDTGANPGESIDSWTTYDAQITFDIAESGLGNFDTVRPKLTIGTTNILNEDPPFADTSNAFPIATRVHDPRGRTIYVKAGVEF